VYGQLQVTSSTANRLFDVGFSFCFVDGTQHQNSKTPATTGLVELRRNDCDPKAISLKHLTAVVDDHRFQHREEITMLVLSRQRDQTIVIGDSIRITIVDVRGDKVRIGIDAPRDVAVHREEVYDAIQRELTGNQPATPN